MATMLHTQCSALVINRFSSATVPEREVNKGVQLIPHVAAIGEAFQVHNQHGRQRPQVQLLSGLLVLFTVWTVPGRQDTRGLVSKCSNSVAT